MRLTRLHVASTLRTGTALALPDEAGAHVARVLRARAGDELVLFNGDGREFPGVVESVRGVRVTVAVGEGRVVDRESPLAVTLVQSVPRGDRMDLVVQKATELGAARIVPVLSQRSVIRLDAAQAASKAQHWQAVAIAACEQCGRNRLPVVEAPRPLIQFLGEATGCAARLVLEPETAGGGPVADLSPAGGEVQIAVGPEGGFAAEELEAFRVAGFARLTLGPRVLRTETAAIAALVWLQIRFGDLGGLAGASSG